MLSVNRVLSYKTVAAGSTISIPAGWVRLRVIPAAGASFTLVNTNIDLSANTLTAVTGTLSFDEFNNTGGLLQLTANGGTVWVIYGA